MAKIHPLAVVSPEARIGLDVVVGPFAIVESDCMIGDGCTLASHVVVKSGTTLGQNCHIHERAVLGGLPQHAHPPGPPGRLEIGQGNTIRENVTVHRSMFADKTTTIGDRCFIMVGAHIAHDCTVGNNVIIANEVQLAGHVTIDSGAFLSGMAAFHQHVRVGRNCMVGGASRVARDVLPFVMVDGESHRIVGLNTVGLRRSGMPSEQIAELKSAYQLVFRSGLSLKEILAELEGRFTSGPASEWASFLRESRRGWVPDRRGHAPAVRLVPSPDEQTDQEAAKRAG